MIPLRNNITTSVLSRNAAQPTAAGLSSIQGQVESVTVSFLEQATDWKSLAAMMAGGLAYRLGKIGVMSTTWAQQAAPLQRPFSILTGLASEVTTFEFTNRTLNTLSRAGFKPAPTDPLWSWFGLNGWKQGWLSSFITFGTLKGFGKLVEGQILILQHASQDLGMLLGHQLLYRVGLGERPEGTLAEQLLHSEAMNLQMEAGMILGHWLSDGRLLSMERGLDLNLKNSERDGRPLFPIRNMATAEAPGLGHHELPLRNTERSPLLLLSSTEKEGERRSRTRKLEPKGRPDPERDYSQQTETERNLIGKIIQSDFTDRRSIEQLIQNYQPFLLKLAGEYSKNPSDRDDLIQEGKLGFLEALMKYDPNRGIRFITYAGEYARGYLLNYILKNFGQTGSTTKKDRALFWRLSRTERQLRNQLKREPTAGELAQAFGVTEDQIQHMRERRSHKDEIPLTAIPLYRQDKILFGISEDSPSFVEGIINQELWDTLEGKLGEFAQTLKGKRAQGIFRMRLLPPFYDRSPATLRVLGKRYGISRERVRQLEETMKQSLRAFLTKEGLGYSISETVGSRVTATDGSGMSGYLRASDLFSLSNPSSSDPSGKELTALEKWKGVEVIEVRENDVTLKRSDGVMKTFKGKDFFPFKKGNWVDLVLDIKG